MATRGCVVSKCQRSRTKKRWLVILRLLIIVRACAVREGRCRAETGRMIQGRLDARSAGRQGKRRGGERDLMVMMMAWIHRIA